MFIIIPSAGVRGGPLVDEAMRSLINGLMQLWLPSNSKQDLQPKKYLRLPGGKGRYELHINTQAPKQDKENFNISVKLIDRHLL